MSPKGKERRERYKSGQACQHRKSKDANLRTGHIVYNNVTLRFLKNQEEKVNLGNA